MDAVAAPNPFDAARSLLSVPYCPQVPTSKQAAFLLDMRREVLYGGAAAGGKSSALLMSALQFISVPDYSAIIFRRSYSDLALPGALMDRARDWLHGSGARWNDIEHTWHFPSGATLAFGYIKTRSDRDRYRSAEFQFVAFDELTQFPEERDYTFLFSRLRRPSIAGEHPLARVPLRMRSATNPGGAGHGWVRRRFIEDWLRWVKKGCPPELKPDRGYHPAKLDDNPYIDQENYEAMLKEMDSIGHAQMRYGDWDIRTEGRLFTASWFPVVPRAEIPSDLQYVRVWDLAATHADEADDPDFTVGVLMGRDKQGRYWIVDVQRLRDTPRVIEQRIVQVARNDGPDVPIRIEQEPGAAGKIVISHFVRLLAGSDVRGVLPSGSKIVRAGPFAAMAEAGNVMLVKAKWNEAWLDEIEAFPDTDHDDQVDASASAFAFLAKRGTVFDVKLGWGEANDGMARSSPWRIGV